MSELNVSRKSIEEILSLNASGQSGKSYIIPEYQRPYKWDIEKCETLWIDITNFYDETKEGKDIEYFLGTIVTCNDQSNPKVIDVIDGQQRLTTIMLMLRAFYSKLEEMQANNPNDKDIIGLMASIAPCIWNVNPMSREVTDKGDIHIHSLVATDKDNDTFHEILETGRATENQKSNYACNYAFFVNKYNEYVSNAPMHWKELCLTIIKKCIMLPIECTDLDAALTIFGTLNDRGMALADSDIFKAELYKQQHTKDEKELLAKRWKNLEEVVSDGGFTIDDLFRYYSHIIRGEKGTRSKEIGLRRFYAGNDNKYASFRTKDFFDKLFCLAEFWSDLNTKNKDFSEESSLYCNTEAKKWLHCLSSYPNEYWKYPTSVFFNYHKNDTDFKEQLAKFLRRLLAYILARFIEYPTVNAIKDQVYIFCIDISKNGDTDFTYSLQSDFKDKISKTSTWRLQRCMVTLEAYLYDDNQKLIDDDFQIEHIFPQKWQNTNYNGWSIDDAKRHLNMYGNKVAFERRLNILAGNGYFGKKKQEYAKSNIMEAKHLSVRDSDDWTKYDIEERDKEVTERIEQFMLENLVKDHLNIKTTELCNIIDGNEHLNINKVGDGTDTYYTINGSFIDYDNTSIQQLKDGDISFSNISNEFPDIESAINLIPKTFLQRHINEIKLIL